MTTPPGLGEPRGPRFISPDLEAYGQDGEVAGGRGIRAFPTGWRLALLGALAVVAVSAASGGIAGSITGGGAAPRSRIG